MKLLPIECPSCGRKLVVRQLSCQGCGTAVEGLYEIPSLASLSRSDQQFVLQFVKASGSLKQMASLLGVSYPTVRSRLDQTIEELERLETEQEAANG